MANEQTLRLPPMPRPRDYPETVEGAVEYATELASWLRGYVDAVDTHRKGSVETWTKEFGLMVTQHEVDLAPATEPRPGWVARDIDQVRDEALRAAAAVEAALDAFKKQDEKDKAALIKDNKRVRSYLLWSIITSASALVSLAGFLAGQLILKGAGAE